MPRGVTPAIADFSVTPSRGQPVTLAKGRRRIRAAPRKVSASSSSCSLLRHTSLVAALCLTTLFLPPRHALWGSYATILLYCMLLRGCALLWHR